MNKVLENKEVLENGSKAEQVSRDHGGGTGHIRCLSAVPADIEELLAELCEADSEE